MHAETIEVSRQVKKQAKPGARRVGRPSLSEDGSEQVSIRYPKFVLEAAARVIEERGGPEIADRAAVLREATVKGLQAMGALPPQKG